MSLTILVESFISTHALISVNLCIMVMIFALQFNAFAARLIKHNMVWYGMLFSLHVKSKIWPISLLKRESKREENRESEMTPWSGSQPRPSVTLLIDCVSLSHSLSLSFILQQCFQSAVHDKDLTKQIQLCICLSSSVVN